MRIFLLWASIFSFSVFMLSILPVSLRFRQRGKKAADRIYLWLMLCYCLWLITFSVLFFSEAFVRPLPPVIRTSFGLFRAVITIAVLVFYTLFLYALKGSKRNRTYLSAVLIPSIIYIILIIPVFLKASVFFANLVTLLFNVFLTGLSLYALVTLKKRKKVLKVYTFFIRLMLIYCSAGILIVLLPLNSISVDFIMVLTVIPRAAFCLVWGVIELLVFIKREYTKELEHKKSVSSVFLKDYEITSRETDVIKCIAAGFSNKQTADELFISEKTVETHIYSIYRKCRVKNKVELLNLINSSR